MEIKVNIDGLKEFTKKLTQYPEISKKYYTEALGKSAIDLTNSAIQYAPVDTGTMRKTIFWESNNNLEAFVNSPAKYSIYVHEGTRPHLIGSAVNIRGIGWRYIKMHPGTMGIPFMTQGIRTSEPNFTRFFSEAMDLINQEIAKL